MPQLLQDVILNRHSSRSFLPTPIPRHVLTHALSLAAHAPSNSNIQPWRLFIASGPARDRLAASLLAAASSVIEKGEMPRMQRLPDDFQQHRWQLGSSLWGELMGVPRHDKKARAAAELLNYNFFGAPTVIIVAIDRRLGSGDVLGVGMYLQLLLLALDEEGIGACCQVSLLGYEDVIRKELGIDNGLDILCGVSVGYPDLEAKLNTFRATRDLYETTTRFFDE
ncbi:Nitroreductase NfnB [Cladobotryum mycophilum]|uniref:Nitroreductase NfnB n=1 Tax=Cladobotryum mycophilum TaxID=491253 RepID=A0ABR0SIS3_9HYPO